MSRSRQDMADDAAAVIQAMALRQVDVLGKAFVAQPGLSGPLSGPAPGTVIGSWFLRRGVPVFAGT